jgi:hypothetical protein
LPLSDIGWLANITLDWKVLQLFLIFFSLSMMAGGFKLECLSLATLFLPNLIFEKVRAYLSGVASPILLADIRLDSKVLTVAYPPAYLSLPPML